MQFYGLHASELHEQIFLNAMVHTKQYTVVFANGEMTVHFFIFLKL